MGLDFVFHNRRKVVIKVIVHNNLAGHYDFGVYNRCKFELIHENNGIPLYINLIIGLSNSSGVDAFIETLSITDPPVVSNRWPVTTLDSTKFYGSSNKNLIFEEMNGYIAAVTILIN